MKKLLLYSVAVSSLLFSQTGLIAQPGTVYKPKGKLSANSENVNKEADPKFTSIAINPAVLKKVSQPGNQQQVSKLEHGMAIVTEIVNRMLNNEYDFSLLSSHKYMVNDCLGMKVSSGQFKLKFSSPSIELTNSGNIKIRLEVNKINFSALKVRIKPRAPDLSDPNPCHFSGKFEIGGEATDLSVTLTLNLVVTVLEGSSVPCFFAFGAPVSIKWNIGGLNLKPHPNALDNVAKEMVEDALNTGLDNIIYTKFIELSREVIPQYYESCEAVYNAEKIKNIANPITPADTANIESKRWNTTANNLKTSTGRLLIDNPTGSKWTIYIYSMPTNKSISSANQMNNKGQFVLSPGEYKITINNAPVQNVQIKKGYDTKLETGVLNITDDATWYLYDEAGKTSYTSGNKPEKLVLPVGTYKITLNNAPIEKVLVEKGLDTKLKTGELDITANEVWYLYDESGKTSYTSGDKPGKLILPLGNYVLKTGGADQPVVVNEIAVANEIGIENTEDLIKNTHGPWVITDLPGLKTGPGKIEKGLLDLNFDGNSNWSMHIKNTETGQSFQANRNTGIPTRDRTLSLAPGEYDINLNNVIIKNVPIISNKKTRVKAGLVTVQYVTPGGSSLPVKVYVYDMARTYNEYYFLANGPLQRIMPVGTYGLRVWGDWPANSLEINDKESKQLIITTNIFKIHSNGVSWLLCNTDETVIPCYFFGGNGTRMLYLPLGNYKLKYGTTSVTVTVSSTGQNFVTIPQ